MSVPILKTRLDRREFLAGVMGLAAGGRVSAQTRTFDTVVVLIGPPGSGKSTQADRLARRYGCGQISLSSMVKETYGKKVKKKDPLAGAIESGDLLTDAEANNLLRQRLVRGDLFPGFILDGYPRTAGQVDFLNTLLKDLRYKPAQVVDLSIPDELARQRLKRRGRADDDPANIDRRLAAYKVDQELLRSRYEGSSQYFRIDASGSENDVFNAIRTALKLP